MQQPKLILIPGFGANKYILSKYIDVLDDFLDVTVIDLPGMDKDIKYTKPLDINYYKNYIEGKLKELNYENYIISGLSMGYAIINSLELDNSCNGIIALLPFLGTENLNKSKKNDPKNRIILKTVLKTKQEQLVWERTKFKEFLGSSFTEREIELALKTIDPHAYFSIGRQLLKTKNIIPRNDKPTVLMISKNDEMVNYERTKKAFKDNVDNLKVIETTLSHFPRKTSEDLIRQNINKNTVKEIESFLVQNVK